MTDDAELLRRYAETRSESAFAELVQRHLDLVYAAALRRLNGDTHRAADVTQHVFIALARHAAPLSRRPVLASWLHTATRHAAIDLIRQETRRAAREQHAHAMETVNAPAPPAADWEKLRPVLDEAIDELPDRDRAIILLRFFENQSFTEVGAKLSLNEDAARMRAHRALEKLRELLTRRGVTSTAAALGATLAAQPIVAAPAGLAISVTTACATSVASTLTSAATFTLMTATAKIALTATVVIATFAISTAVYEARVIRQTKLALLSVQQTHAALQAQNATLSSHLATATADSVRLSAEQKETAAQLIQARSAAKAPASNPINKFWLNPDYGRASVERDRALLGTRYGEFYRDLHLTAEQIAAFEKAFIEREQSIVDIWSVATAQGLSPNDTSVVRLTTEPYTLFQKNLHALLGDTGEAQFQEYEKGAKSREFVTSLAGSLYSTDMPLSAAQGSTLTALLKANTQIKSIPMKDEGPKTIYTRIEETDWAAVTAQAQALLSPFQLSTLKQLGEKQRAENDMMQLQQAARN